MTDKVTFFLLGIIYLAVLYVMIRPNSQGPTLINTVLSTFADVVRGVAGQTYDPTSGKWSAGGG